MTQVVFLVLAFVLYSSAEYDGNANGGFNLFTWYGDQVVTTCKRGQEAKAGGVSSGRDLTFGRCVKATNWGLEGNISPLDNDAYFQVTYTGDHENFTVTTYTASDCESGVLWSITNITEEECVCEPEIYGGCFWITVPRWDAKLFNVDSCKKDPAEFDRNLLKNKCYDGSELGLGYFMLWTFQCQDNFSCRRSEQATGVRHQLVYDCLEGCQSDECSNTWTINPTDCKCDGEGCILADFNTPAGTFASSLGLLLTLTAFVLASF